MWNWISNSLSPASSPKTKTTKQLHRSSSGVIREEYVQKAVNFLSHPSVRDQPQTHLHFLESKGLTAGEIQESLNRISNEELVIGEHDSIFVLPAHKFEEFLCRIRQPDALDVRNTFQSFIKEFKNGFGQSYCLEDKSKMVHNLVDLSTEAVTNLYDKANIKTQHLIISECVERYLMTELFDSTFMPVCGDVKADRLFWDKMITLERFMHPKHLDIPTECNDDTLYNVAQEELMHINSYKAPRDKLMCIVKACKIIFSAIELLCKNQPVNADLFLPVLIYNIVKANPPYLKTNISFIQNFRHPSKMRLECGYFFVSFSTAVSFLEELTAKSLTIDPEEYDRYMNSNDNHSTTRAFHDESPKKIRTKYDINEHLFHSCAAGDFEMVRELVLHEGASINITHVSSSSNIIFLGDSPLSVACRLGNVTIAQFLLDHGAMIKMLHHPEKRSVLHMECLGHEIGKERSYNFPIIKLLVDYGADIHQQDKYGLSPLDYAKKTGISYLLVDEKNDDDLASMMETLFLTNDVPTSPTRFREASFTIHEVIEGQSLQDICDMHGIDIITLRILNNMDDDTTVEPSRKLSIPSKKLTQRPNREIPDKKWKNWRNFFD